MHAHAIRLLEAAFEAEQPWLGLVCVRVRVRDVRDQVADELTKVRSLGR